MYNWNAIVSFIEQFNTITGFLSFIVSCFTLIFSIRIKNKIENAKDEQRLSFKKKQIIGDLRGYSIFIDKNQIQSIDKHSLESYLIELEESFLMLKKKKKKVFKNLYISINNEDWLMVKRGLSNLVTYIERI